MFTGLCRDLNDAMLKASFLGGTVIDEDEGVVWSRDEAQQTLSWMDTAPHQVQRGGDMKRKLIVGGLAAALYAVYGIVVLDALYSHKQEQHASAAQENNKWHTQSF